MSKNYDIETASKYLHDQSTVALGGVVPSGMKRYVTFLRVTPLTAAGNLGSKLYICSTPASDSASNAAAASAAQKMVFYVTSGVVGAGTNALSGIVANREVQVPDTPDTEHPLFTIAAGKYLTAHVGTAAGQTGPVQLFTQFFDE